MKPKKTKREIEFEIAMQKEWMSRPKGAVGKGYKVEIEVEEDKDDKKEEMKKKVLSMSSVNPRDKRLSEAVKKVNPKMK